MILVIDGQRALVNNNSYIPEVSNEMTDIAPELHLFLKSLAGEARVRILVLLGTRGGLTVGEVAEHLDMGLSTVSEHLKELRRAGLVIYRKDGKNVHYTLCKTTIVRNLEVLQHLLTCC